MLVYLNSFIVVRPEESGPETERDRAREREKGGGEIQKNEVKIQGKRKRDR